jgi:gliding motility-associated-like protein
MPVSLEQIEGNNPTIRATAFSDSGIFNTDQRFSTIDQNRYWQLSFQNYEGAYIELPLLGNNNFTDIEKLVVIATDEANGDIENLGEFDNSGTLNNGFVASDQLALQQYYTLAQLPEEAISGTDINVFNVITPNGDGKHDFLNIENINEYPNNTVTIYNKWGNKLWQISAYNNRDKVFIGIADNGNELLTGNYHYVIDKGNGDKPLKGFLFIQR